jgi:asparagine synthase (glutamine-hydrolysing)
MCGIAGIFHFDAERKIDLSVIKKMTDIISYRGPDGEGFYVHNNLAFGHRRLSIIDLSTGDQPMFNESKDIALILNGEIYNYIELRNDLIKLGHNFRTTSDTEVIIRAYEEWGVECQAKFNGMWSFALWDEKKQQLLLSRDRVGEKPLHYSVFGNSLIFGSEIKSLFEYGVPREIRPELIELYLVLTNIPGPDTFYKNIFKLKPGHFILANVAGVREFKYWDLPQIDEKNMLKDKSAIYEEFTSLFEQAVKIRMRSDVPFGAFLSGGLDSSSIVALMTKISKHPVETFTVGFPQKDFDESLLSKLVAEKFKTNHHIGSVNPSSMEDAIKRSVLHFDEPFGDSSAIPTYQVSNFAREKVKMVLTGDGGDEVLSGYDSYAGIKFSNMYSKLPVLLQKTLPKGIEVLSKTVNGGIRYKLNRVVRVLQAANHPFAERVAFKNAFIPLPVIKMLTSNINNLIKIEDYLADVMQSIPYQDDFYRMMYLNFKYNLPDDYLVKVDRMSMANSIETRAPFLDHLLIEFMARVDKNVKMQGWERKSILRNTIGKQLPEQLLNVPKKGFGIPLRDWFKNDYNADILSLTNLNSVCDSKVIKQIVDDNANGARDNGNFLWTLIMLDEFMN